MKKPLYMMKKPFLWWRNHFIWWRNRSMQNHTVKKPVWNCKSHCTETEVQLTNFFYLMTYNVFSLVCSCSSLHGSICNLQILDLAQLVEHTTVTVTINCMVAGSIPAVEIIRDSFAWHNEGKSNLILCSACFEVEVCVYGRQLSSEVNNKYYYDTDDNEYAR